MEPQWLAQDGVEGLEIGCEAHWSLLAESSVIRVSPGRLSTLLAAPPLGPPPLGLEGQAWAVNSIRNPIQSPFGSQGKERRAEPSHGTVTVPVKVSLLWTAQLLRTTR